jgi:hypothetical protein
MQRQHHSSSSDRKRLGSLAALLSLVMGTAVLSTATPAQAETAVVIRSGSLSVYAGQGAAYDHYNRYPEQFDPYQRYPSQTVYRRRTINNATLVNPVIVDSNIRNSTLINPVVIDSRDRGSNTVIITPGRRYTYSQPRMRSNCLVMADLRAACR